MRYILLITMALFSITAFAKPPVEIGTFNNKAIYGYDPIGYWTENKAVKGSDDHVFTWRGAEWHFASEENLNTFKSDPEKYAPQYGGYCAFGLANEKLVSIDPDAFTIYNDKLYLNYSERVSKRWLENKDEFIEWADENYPKKVDLPE